MDPLYDNWKGLVTQVAQLVAREFPEVEPDDLYQDLWVEVVRRNEPEPNDYSFNALLKVATQAAWGYRKQSLTLTAQYAYRTADVKQLVQKYLFNDDYWRNSVTIDAQIIGDGIARDVVPVDERTAVRADIEYAYSRLSESDRRVMEKAYREGLQLSNPERMRLWRALAKMTDTLNFYRGTCE
jgi:hypothetical protein